MFEQALKDISKAAKLFRDGGATADEAIRQAVAIWSTCMGAAATQAMLGGALPGSTTHPSQPYDPGFRPTLG